MNSFGQTPNQATTSSSEASEVVKGFKINAGDKLEFNYMNAQGTVGSVVAIVKNFWFGTNNGNPEPGVLIEAIDCKTNTTRYFLAMDMTDIKGID